MKAPVASVSRRAFLASALGACAITTLPTTVLGKSPEKVDGLAQVDLTSATSFCNSIDGAGIGWHRFTLNDHGDCCLIGSYRTHQLATECASADMETKGIVSKILDILVRVGTKVIGYIKVLVKKAGPWIVEEVISTGAHYLLQLAAKNMLGKPYVSTYTFSCDIYPPHSGEYHRCMSS